MTLSSETNLKDEGRRGGKERTSSMREATCAFSWLVG